MKASRPASTAATGQKGEGQSRRSVLGSRACRELQASTPAQAARTRVSGWACSDGARHEGRAAAAAAARRSEKRGGVQASAPRARTGTLDGQRLAAAAQRHALLVHGLHGHSVRAKAGPTRRRSGGAPRDVRRRARCAHVPRPRAAPRRLRSLLRAAPASTHGRGAGACGVEGHNTYEGQGYISGKAAYLNSQHMVKESHGVSRSLKESHGQSQKVSRRLRASHERVSKSQRVSWSLTESQRVSRPVSKSLTESHGVSNVAASGASRVFAARRRRGRRAGTAGSLSRATRRRQRRLCGHGTRAAGATDTAAVTHACCCTSPTHRHAASRRGSRRSEHER
jgi:hypothetical protein